MGSAWKRDGATFTGPFVAINTVRRYLRDGDADRYRPRPRRSSKLAAFVDDVLP
jgi:hypothetical protein